ncbi:MAG: lipid-A-disaccharide synthase [Bacteroidales bacterium]|nr:lipid-A-disaccharide synthase [Bacteroidales bacterium]
MKYYIIAGEASGDLYGALLIKALREQDPAAEFRFWGGDAMATEAASAPVRHIRDLAIMGFVEVLAHLGTVLGNIKFCKRDIAAYRPDVVVGIDYPGFNLKLEAWAKQHGFKTVHFISPNLWAWKKGRIKGMRRSLDRLCYILPFEEPFFAENNMPQALYVGHPLLDAIAAGSQQSAASSQLTADKPIIALMPGSRRMELKNSLPKMVQLAQRHPEYHFVVAGMTLLGEAAYRKYIPADSPIEIAYNQTYSLLSSAHAAVVCSGTATLETALFGVPQVVCYSGNPISYLIAKSVVGKRIKYISLVNLIADQPVVTELIQEDFSAERLEKEFALITTDHATRQRMFDEYAKIRTQLGDGGAIQRTAQAIHQLLTEH